MTHNRITGRWADALAYVFYAAVVAVAGLGCATAATRWTDWGLWAILPAVGLLELSAVALLVRADHRRRLGERAGAYRILAVGVGLLAVSINVFGHLPNALSAALFGGFSALGLGVALLMSGDRRRDHLRATGNLPPTTPAYGAWQWTRHPMLTWRAKEAAKREPELGLYGSLAAAAEGKRGERRHAALKALLLDLIGQKYGDPLVAELVAATVDMDETTRRFAAAADLDAFVGELWARVPIGAAVSTPAEITETAAVEAEIVEPPKRITAVRQASKHRLSDSDARRVVEWADAAEPGVPATALAHIATRSPRRVREIRAAIEKTAEQPVVKPRESGGREGLGLLGFTAKKK